MGERVGCIPLDGEPDRVQLHSATIIPLLANDKVKYPYVGIQRIKKSFFSGLMATPIQVTKNNESKQKVYPMMGRMTTLSC